MTHQGEQRDHADHSRTHLRGPPQTYDRSSQAEQPGAEQAKTRGSVDPHPAGKWRDSVGRFGEDPAVDARIPREPVLGEGDQTDRGDGRGAAEGDATLERMCRGAALEP